jgi:bis(5'-nucleosyl)-tetraphosphatase (symmetrical)
MSTYAIGDIQGCYKELQQLLALINFDPKHDTLWCTGDLVNRGPQSLEVLRFFKSLGERAISVLGNHDLHLLVIAYGFTEYLNEDDTFNEILAAPDREELMEWLRHLPFLHHDAERDLTLIHAGLPPQWDLKLAIKNAREVESVLRGKRFKDYLAHLYGNKPRKWSSDLEGWDRMRFITNCFTRLRYCNAEGKLALKRKGSPSEELLDNKEGDYPWFMVPKRESRHHRIIFGHWSTLGYRDDHSIYALDTGCLWGGSLTALRLEDRKVFCIDCHGERTPIRKKS